MRFLGTALAIISIFVAGMGVTLALWRRTPKILAAELFGFSWLFGAATVSALLAICGALLPARSVFPVVVVACVGLAIFVAQRFRTGFKVELGIAGAPAWERGGSLLVLVPVIYLASLTFRDCLSWDGLVIWEAKARHAFLAGGALPAEHFSDAMRMRFHHSYPLYLPLSELWVYEWLGDCDQTAVKAIFPVFFAAAVALLWSTVLRLTGRAWIATTTALLPVFISSMADRGLGLFQGYADFILGTVYMAGVGAFLAWKIKDSQPAWIMAVASAAVVPWIKHEGLLLYAGLVAVAAVGHGFRQWKRTLVFALPGAMTILVWKAFLHIVHVVEQKDFQSINLETLRLNLPRLGPILQAMGREFSKVANWSLLWFLVPVALGCLLYWRRPIGVLLSLAIVIPLALDIVPFFFTALTLEFHLGTALTRLILQVSPVAVLALGLALDAANAQSVKDRSP
jgi:hypothetical protein